jgi:acyl-[acyl-carrier-protein]-phospholipid O-acyltransferase / long-chain-fatty-acid--[acyl-carrier-protein] ligase
VPDARKGERLVLITTERGATREAMLKQAKAVGATELSAPTHVMVIEKLPLVGSGKIDYVTASAMANARFVELLEAV